MKKFLIIFALLYSALAQTNSLTVYEGDAVIQSGRVVKFGRVFKQGEIANYPQPAVTGQSVTTWQADVKNRWSDGSVRFAIVGYVLPTMAANGSYTTTFSNSANTCSSCTGGTPSGFLNQAGMVGFNGGNWNAQIVTTPNAPTLSAAAVTTDLKTVLGASDPGLNTFGDCKNDYWLEGPVYTSVIVQDCTSAFSTSFGWKYDGTNMNSDGVNPSYTTTSAYATFNPMAVLTFYPSSNTVEVEFILETPWTGRAQDQKVSLSFLTGSPATQVWSSTSAIGNVSGVITVLAGKRIHKTFYSGTAPGHIFFDHNNSYLKTTGLFPYLDQNFVLGTTQNNPGTGNTSFSQWITTDKGEVGGTSGFYEWAQDYSGNEEGAIIQYEEVQYLLNMGSGCGIPNSDCRKTWAQLTGEVDSNPSTTITAASVPGGGGAWGNVGNVTFHLRDSRTTATGNITSGNAIYCSSLDDKNAVLNAASCGTGVGTATGHAISRHTHSTDQYGGDASIYGVPSGSVHSASPWSIGDCSHWLDYSYTPYLLTGSYYQLENEYQGAAICALSPNPDPQVPYGGAKFFAYSNHSGNIVRKLAWGMLSYINAATVAPDQAGSSCNGYQGQAGSAEACLFNSYVNSNIEVQCGLMGLSCPVAVTPTVENCSGASCTFTATSANRWDWGRAKASGCSFSGTGTCTTLAMALHNPAEGFCDSSQRALLNTTNSITYYQPWHTTWLVSVLGTARYRGFSNVSTLSDEMNKWLVERILDDTFSPYLLAAYMTPVHTNVAACNAGGYSVDPYISTYSALKAAYANVITGTATKSGTTITWVSNTIGPNGTAQFLNNTVSSNATWVGKTIVYNGSNCTIASVQDGSHLTVTSGACAADQASAVAYSIALNSLPAQGTFDGFSSSTHYWDNQNFANSITAMQSYSMGVRAAATFPAHFGVTSSDVNCPGGTCTGRDAWSFAKAEVPYGSTSLNHCTPGSSPFDCSGAAVSTVATVYDPSGYQAVARWAFTAQPADTCSITSPANLAVVSGTITISGAASTATSGTITTQFTKTISGITSDISTGQTGATPSVTLDTTTLANGSVTLGGSCADNAGGLGSTIQSITVSVLNIGNTNGVLSNGAKISNGAIIR